MLTAHRFSEFNWNLCNLPCRAYTLFKLVSTSCKIYFKAQSIGSKGTKKIMLTLILYYHILWCRDRIFDLNCKHSVLTMCCFLNRNIIIILSCPGFFRDCHRFTLRKLYIFLEALLCFLHQFGQAHSKEKQQLVRDEIVLLAQAALLPQLKYDWLSIDTVGKTATTSNDQGNLPWDTLA